MQSLTHYYGHLVIVHRTLKLLCFKAIVRHCIVLFCGTIIKKSTFSKIRVAFNNAYRKIFGLPKRSSASAMYATHNICNFETMLRKNIYGFMQRLEHSTNTIIRNLYQSWIVRCDIWSSWIKSLYVM